MRIMFIDNDGGGFADMIEVRDGIALHELFDKQMGDRPPEDFLIRVNRQPATSDQVLREGDRVSMTPTKIAGALRGA